MSYPKWKYRKHPELGVFQSTLVANEKAESELDADWSDDPTSTGFKVRPAMHLHVSHFVAGTQMHELVTDAEGLPVQADIKVVLNGDANHVV